MSLVQAPSSAQICPNKRLSLSNFLCSTSAHAINMPGTAQQRSLTSFFSPKTSSGPPNADKKETSEATLDSMSSSSRSSSGKSKGSSSKRASISNSAAEESPKRAKIAEKPGAGAGASNSSPIEEPGWASALEAETSKPYFRKLEAFLDGAYASNKGAVYPPREKLFNAFESCPLDAVKVVILGQDPYHQPGQAHGLAFSVMPGVSQPPSLRNMIKEAVSCCGIRPTKSGTLDSWCKQGVLLLNTVLSVQDSKPNSHRKQGWETFTDAVVRELNKGNRRLVFMLWGKPSQKKGAIIDASKHRVLSCNHPSPLSATKGPIPFMGFACFKKANEALTELGHGAVDWNVE